VQAKIARMAALTYAMDAVLYQTCGMLDRHDEDIMLETAVCKLFCSEMGWRVVNDAMQIMGGEGYMTENQVERIFRDSRINLIVEGANEVMQSFIFAYGGKQLAEKLLGVQQAVGWDHHDSPTHNLARILRGLKHPAVVKAAAPLGAELFLGIRPAAPHLTRVAPQLHEYAQRLCKLVQEHSHEFKRASKHYGEQIVSRQSVQARLADSAMWLHVWACTLSKLDHDVRTRPRDAWFDRDKAAAKYFFDMAETEVRNCFRALVENDDDSMLAAAKAALAFSDELPNSRFVIPEKSPIARGTGRPPKYDGIRQFPGDAPTPGHDIGGNGRVIPIAMMPGITPSPGTLGEGRGERKR